MAILRRPRLLTCFYCNQRTSIAYDGSLRQFQCRSCDATNYLDQNGDITDPPASTTAGDATPSTFYAAPPDPFHDGSNFSNGSPNPPNNTFCSTCLKNQHLFVASLAQYFPSDPNDPETPALERRYFAFRKGLEQRYPQICADCEPRVLARIRDADYTAKTDHLRRMVQYSRDVRLTQTTPLDVAHRLGRWLWWAALVLQVLWQLGVVGGGLLRASGREPDAGFGDDAVVGDDDDHNNDNHTTPLTMAIPLLLQPVLHILAAHATRLQSLCFGATVAGCLWNPYLVETVRGFTRPLRGIPTWYAYQAALVALRFLLSKVDIGTATSTSTAGLPPTVAGAHAVAALFTLYLYSVAAPRAITKDLRPLFGKLPELPVTPQKLARRSSEQQLQQLQQSEDRRQRGLETLSDVLDEIATTTPQRGYSSPAHNNSRRDSDADGWDGWQPAQSIQRRPPTKINAYGSPYAATTTTTTTPATAYYDADEMDWTPTTTQTQTPARAVAASPPTTPSPHRAFNAFSNVGATTRPPPALSSPVSAFSQTPVEANKGPFWYKVPPAPTSIAQRIFNRPNAPRIVQQAGKSNNNDGAGATLGSSPLFDRSRAQAAPNFDAHSPAGLSSSVEFAQPSFFAEDLYRKTGGGGNNKGPDDDPGSFLSDLFSQTFSLGQPNDDDDGSETEVDDEGDYDAASPGARTTSSQGTTVRGRRRSSVHQRRRGADLATRGQLVVQRLPQVLATVASLAGVSLLREGLQSDSTMLSPETTAGSMDQLLLAYVRPHAQLVEAAAVGLCMVLAVSLTRESTTLRGRTRSAGVVVEVVGVVLGVASVVLAGWMAVQMAVPLLQQQSQQSLAAAQPIEMAPLYDSYNDDSYSDYGWRVDDDDEIVQPQGLAAAGLPWPWWQFATLHGTLLVHQVWNVFVQ